MERVDYGRQSNQTGMNKSSNITALMPSTYSWAVAENMSSEAHRSFEAAASFDALRFRML